MFQITAGKLKVSVVLTTIIALSTCNAALALPGSSRMSKDPLGTAGKVAKKSMKARKKAAKKTVKEATRAVRRTRSAAGESARKTRSKVTPQPARKDRSVEKGFQNTLKRTFPSYVDAAENDPAVLKKSAEASQELMRKRRKLSKGKLRPSLRGKTRKSSGSRSVPRLPEKIGREEKLSRTGDQKGKRKKLRKFEKDYDKRMSDMSSSLKKAVPVKD